MLSELLGTLKDQETMGLFTYSILVVDNDRQMSAKETVTLFKKTLPVEIDYVPEPLRGIPIARNRAVKESRGTYVAFVDDDEFATQSWLANLYHAAKDYGVMGVLGPVKPHFPVQPPRWVVKSGLFDRRSFKTGTKLDWHDTRTGNVLLNRAIFADEKNLFNPKIGHGEDKDFFRRMIAQGHCFVWCNEAEVYETEPPERFKRTYFLRRALIRGSYYFARSSCKPVQLVKSIAFLSGYGVLLPLSCLVGHHFFMKTLIKICDHLGSLAGACGINVEKRLHVG